jgi:secreted Zn-dependent insulinase-like peptidase
MGAIAIFLFKFGSRNKLNNKRREKPFVANYEQTFGVRLPHQDTTKDVLRKLSPEKLEQVKMDLISNMLEQKWLQHYRLQNKYYLVAIDATGVVSFDHKHCEHCLTKTSKNGVVTYYHYVLETKLVTRDGHCLSVSTIAHLYSGRRIISLRRGISGL